MAARSPNRFIGRKEQLQSLQRLTGKKVASLAVIKGRRRIGKSRLIDEFAKNYPYYKLVGLAPGEGVNAQTQREEFSRQLSRQFGVPPIKADDWGDLLDWLGTLASTGQRVVLLDEITWMAQDDATFLPKLKNAWDNHFSKNPQLILILCGSISAWIEKNILSSTGYFGRVAYEITLDELPLGDCCRLLKTLGFKGSSLEHFIILSLTGGIPWYLELIDPSLSAIENIKALCFRKSGILVNEYQRVFHDLFGRRNVIYRKIIDALARGPQDYTTLATQINYPTGGPLSDYLEELTLSGFISRDYTWSINTGRQIDVSKYRLQDNFLRFYLKCISPNLTKINKDLFRQAALSTIPAWSTIAGLQFENLVLHNRELLWQALNINPAEIVNENPYLQRKTKLQQGCQIDYLIQTKFNVLYVIEIKFSQRTIGLEVIDELKQKIAAIKANKNFYVKPVLIHSNHISQAVINAEYFAAIIDFKTFLSTNNCR